MLSMTEGAIETVVNASRNIKRIASTERIDPEMSSTERREANERTRYRNVTLPPCKFLGRLGPYNWGDVKGENK